MLYISTVLDCLLQRLPADFQKISWELNKHKLPNQQFVFSSFSKAKSEFNPDQRPGKPVFMFRDKESTFVNLKTSLQVCFVFAKFPYFNFFNNESSPVRFFLHDKLPRHSFCGLE